MGALRPRSMMEAAPLMLGCIAPLGLAFIAIFFHQAQALDIAYCTEINTASRAGNYSIYQSNGLCRGFCENSYAFAILQDKLCWCSNYAPATTESGSKCNKECPGFPPDRCGGDDLYGYIKLDKPAAGTKSESGAGVTASPIKNPTTTAPPESDATWTPTPITTIQTITGQVRVVTITPTAPPSSPKKSSGLSTGAAAGLGIGLAALASIIGILIFLFLRRRRRRAADATTTSPTPANGYTPQRTMSENSRYMLGTDGHRVVEGWDGDPSDTPVSAGSRRSRLMPVDPRLDPFAPVYQREGRRSGESVGSIQDNHDYSRRVHQTGPILRATNPDT